MSSKENVNHSDHYNLGSLEVIEAIRGLGLVDDFCVGNVIKYICRYKHKNGIEDLKKAKWYLEYLIQSKEQEENRPKDKKSKW